jgi:hypothetical protein
MRLDGVLLVTLLWLLPSAVAAESYLCIPDKATGFKFDAKQEIWRNVEFMPEFKYVVTQADDSSK